MMINLYNTLLGQWTTFKIYLKLLTLTPKTSLKNATPLLANLK